MTGYTRLHRVALTHSKRVVLTHSKCMQHLSLQPPRSSPRIPSTQVSFTSLLGLFCPNTRSLLTPGYLQLMSSPSNKSLISLSLSLSLSPLSPLSLSLSLSLSHLSLSLLSLSLISLALSEALHEHGNRRFGDPAATRPVFLAARAL